MRSKGFAWWAKSHADALHSSHDGSTFELSCLGQWWATLPRDQWPAGVQELVLKIVFVGPTLGDRSAQRVVSQSLDQCLDPGEEYEEDQSIVVKQQVLHTSSYNLSLPCLRIKMSIILEQLESIVFFQFVNTIVVITFTVTDVVCRLGDPTLQGTMI